MSVTEILDEISKLPAEERHLVAERLEELEAAEIEESPEFIAALEEGIRSLEKHGGPPLEEVATRLKAKWASR